MSAGEAFWKMAAGRSGLDTTCPIPDNVWDIDCSTLLDPKLMDWTCTALISRTEMLRIDGDLLKGMDRTVLLAKDDAPAALPKAQAVTT